MFACLPLKMLATFAFAWGLHGLAPGQTQVEAPSAGFSIEVDEAWAHQLQRSGDRVAALTAGPADRGGIVLLSLQIAESGESGEEASRATIEQLMEQVAPIAQIEVTGRIEMEMDGDVAHGIEVGQADGGIQFKVRLYFLYRGGFQYRIQFHAPQDEFDELWPTAKRAMATFSSMTLDAASAQRQSLRKLAMRCGSQIDWAPNWQSAAEQARSERKLIVVPIHSIPGFNLGSPLMTGPFTDPEVVQLMQQRFVGFKWSPGVEAAFAEPDAFGLGSSTFGSGVLVVKPDGEVIRQIYLPEALFVLDALCAVVQGHPRLDCPQPVEGASRAERAAHWLDCGEIDRARASLGIPEFGENAALAFQRARYLRIQRQGEAALQSLAGAPPDAATQIERCLVQLGMGHAEDAEQTALTVTNYEPSPAQSAYAELLLATLQLARKDVDAATRTLESITENFPEEAAAWVAASALTGPSLSAAAEVSMDLSWPPAASFAMAELGPAAEPGASPEQMLEQAIEWLLLNQDTSGRWITPTGLQDALPGRGPVTMASQIIAVQALVEFATHSDTPAELAKRCRSAALLGLRSYREDRELVRKHPRPVAYMDYTCWGSSYGAIGLGSVLDQVNSGQLTLLAHELEATRAELADCVADLVRIQQANGGWSYYLSGEIDGDATVAAMSFTTATVLNALEDGMRHGIAVNEAALNRGYDCLAALRGSNGIFDYLTMGAELPQTGEISAPGAAGRGPLCVRTLVRAGRLEVDQYPAAFSIYVQYLPSYGRESRKALMHAGVDTQGSHYLTYDYATGAEALAHAPEAQIDEQLRAKIRHAILTELSRCRSADGSFIDNPLIGPAAGTGLAVQCLLDLEV